MNIFVFVFAFSILAASWDIVFGYAGQLNLGPVFPFGVAGFSTAYLEIDFHLPTWLALLGGAVFGMGAGLALAGPSLRLKSDYLGMVTLAMALAAQLVAVIQTGEEGLSKGITQLAGGDVAGSYYVGLALMAGSCTFMYWLSKTRIGLRFKAVREDQVVAEAMGINTTFYKLLAFAVNCFFSGIAGSFLTVYIAHVDFTYLALGTSFQIIAMAIVGGIGTIIGPIVGAFLLYFPSAFLVGQGVTSLIVYGALIVVVMSLPPEGLVTTAVRLITLLNTRGRSPARKYFQGHQELPPPR